MSTEVREHYGLLRQFQKAGFYETDAQKQIFKDVKADILSGKLIALTGIIGCGKTVTLRKLEESMKQEGKVVVSRSYSVEKQRTTIETLISALFYDLSSEKEVKIPTKPEKRERELYELIKTSKKPVVLIVDEAHELYSQTLTKIKRLIEMIEGGDGILSVLLAGHPKLRNDLRRPTMEEIGYRTTVYSLDNIIGSQRDYIEWLMNTCTARGTKVSDLLEPSAIDMLASVLRTPLQIEQYLTLAFEAAYLIGEKPVTAAIVESVLSKQINDLEPTLTRNGYNIKSLAEQFNAKPSEIKAFFRGEIEPARARNLQEQMLAAGLPL
jgi:type II secretory pathway predicted ATPase ExeA